VKLPPHPLVHEIFTWVWLHDLSTEIGRPVTLGDVPDEVWNDVAGTGVDVVWLMGVWARSPAGAAIARTNPAMVAAQREALPDGTDDDVVGSAYCIRDYVVDEQLGGEAGLAAARAALAARGVGLVLDFVPNHVAPDHPWATEHPEWFVGGTQEDLARDPEGFLAVGDAVIARGRDPYFPPWPEVLQLDASLPALREAAAGVVGAIAARCDGVRCDMAMLVLDDIFVRTWGDRALGGTSPDGGRGYWPTVITAVRASHPGFAFWAEAYWDLEPRLVEQGFDACYDKRLYDRLVHSEPASAIRDHLGADPGYQAHTLRFVENHDEPRIAAVLPSPADQAAAVVALTLPGVALLHEGQASRRRVRVPVTLGRRPVEQPDADLVSWYAAVRAAIGTGMRRGEWARIEVEGWPDNQSCEHLVAWTWTGSERRHLVVVNLSDDKADGRIKLDGATAAPVVLTDALTGEHYLRDGASVGSEGLYVALAPRGAHLLHW
jgi:glycosidase